MSQSWDSDELSLLPSSSPLLPSLLRVIKQELRRLEQDEREFPNSESELQPSILKFSLGSKLRFRFRFSSICSRLRFVAVRIRSAALKSKLNVFSDSVLQSTVLPCFRLTFNISKLSVYPWNTGLFGGAPVCSPGTRASVEPDLDSRLPISV